MADAHLIVRSRPRELPVGYHLAHFREMLDFVERVYGDIIGKDAQQWLTDFRALPSPAQSLFVRIANRKGKVFRVEHLRYDDVPDRAAALEALNRADFASALREADFAAALDVLPKADLALVLLESGQDVRKSWPRARLSAAAKTNLTFEDCFSAAASGDFVVQRRRDTLRYLLFLYFGRIEESLTRFALRDLGLVRTHSFRDDFEARFASPEEAEDSYFYASHLSDLPDATDLEVARMAGSSDDWPMRCDSTQPMRDTLLHDLGRRLERAGDTTGARRLYERGRSAGCGERAVRLAWAAGERESVRMRLEEMIADPASDTEALFAQDFLERKLGGKRTSTITDFLRAADVVQVDESHRASPERGAIEVYSRRGWQAQHAENGPWRVIFGLLFWDVLYGGKAPALHNAFERMPACLRDGSFYDANAEAVEARLALLRDPDAALRAMLKTFAAEYDTPNALFRWHEEMIERLRPLLEHAPPGGLEAIMRGIARDYPGRKDGFPDVMLWRDGVLKLIEIKTENDSLRRNQLVQMSALRDAGFDVSVNRVEWIVDPQQTYVVVDIETTGGRAQSHRVTEIGAVKLRGGEVVDRWQSLINPERPIPRNITELTGITNEMVAGAPLFSEVADAFETFMGEAIFVAHNVRFDHGFLAAEFDRLGRRFRYPQLCTCQSMRSLFKGLHSYSLGNLCRHFDIPLDSHHRAMCDAEAAAGLLYLINQRRMAA